MAEMNTYVEFMYRDASNYKCVRHEIFAGEPTPELRDRLWRAVGALEPLGDGTFAPVPERSSFNPDQVGLLNLRREEMDGDYDDDNDLHEITEITATTLKVQYETRTFEEFVAECEAVEQWVPDTYQHERDQTPHVRVLGDFVHGFTVHGPFPTKAAALAWQPMPVPVFVEPQWAVPLNEVTQEQQPAQESPAQDDEG